MIDDPLNRLKVKRGSQLPHAKLDEEAVSEVLATVDRRDALKRELSTMTNRAMADRLGVHVRTIEKIVQHESWTHVR